MVTVQNSQTPGRQNQQTGAGKEDANEPNCQLSLGAVITRRDDSDQERG